MPCLAAVRPALLLAEDGLPARKAGRRDGSVGVVTTGVEAALDRDLWRVVAVEEGGVDFDAFDLAAGDAEADDDPVKGGLVVAAGLPAVVPGAGVGEHARLADGRRGRGEVLSGREPFVGERQDAGAKRFGNQICANM